MPPPGRRCFESGVVNHDVKNFRQPLVIAGRSRRSLEDRLMVRFPRLLAIVSRAVWRLPTRSRLRRALTRRAVISGWEATDRGDLEVALALYHPDVETIFDPKMVEIGFEPAYRGESRLAVQRRATAEWGEWRFEPQELISIGVDRLLTLGRMNGRGLASGAAVDTDWTSLFTTLDGLVIREQVFLDRDAALEAVGWRRARRATAARLAQVRAAAPRGPLLRGAGRRVRLAAEVPVLRHELARDERRALGVGDHGHPDPGGVERRDDHLAAQLGRLRRRWRRRRRLRTSRSSARGRPAGRRGSG